MNMSEIGEHDQKIDNNEHYIFNMNVKYNKYYHNDEH